MRVKMPEVEHIGFRKQKVCPCKRQEQFRESSDGAPMAWKTVIFFQIISSAAETLILRQIFRSILSSLQCRVDKDPSCAVVAKQLETFARFTDGSAFITLVSS